jgi:uncharacterized repeat protein (TIGR01451 family)
MNSPARRVALTSIIVLTALVLAAPPVAAQCVSLTTLGSASTQDFDTLSNTAGSTTNVLAITGWYLTESGGGARDNEQYAVDNGGSNTGDTFSYGAAASTDRALGGLQSGTLIPVIGACFTNNTGSTITSLDVAYTGEQWRLGTAARTDQIDFQYSADATSLTTGTWTDVNALDFVTPNTVTTGAKDGNAAANRTSLSASIPALSVANGVTVWIRWTDLNASGADDGLAVDDFSVTPQGSGPVVPALSINDVTVTEGNAGTATAAFTVSLSVPAGVGGVTFDIATADNTATTADNDYAANTLTGQTIPVGSTGPYTFNVTVNGDATPESNETFFVNVTNVTGANVGDGQGAGTITNDDVPVYAIYTIQGSGAASPYDGQIVTTNDNVVTAVGTEGFFIQTPDASADADPMTSNGIYVFTSSAPTVAVGDIVDVTGTVDEFFNFTEFSPVTSVTIDSTGNPLPTAIEFDATVPSTDPNAPSCFECWEGMLVHVVNGITSGPNQRFASDLSAEIYGVGSPNRPFRGPGIEYPGLAGLPIWDGNPEVFEIDPDRLGAVSDPDFVPAGSPYSATGVMAYEFNNWELWPTAFTVTPATLPRPVRTRNGGEFTVGTYNLLQLDQSDADYAARLAKHSGYVRTVLGAPDVLGVQECLSITELNALAAQIHTDDATLTYTAYLVEGHDVGGIDVGYLVRDTVTNVVVTQLGFDAVLSLDGSFLHDRPPLLLEATYAGNGVPFAFTVMVNHTRSLIGVEDPGAEGIRIRTKRLEQAQWIAQWIQTYQTAPATQLRPFVMVGDLNAYEFSDGFVDVVGQMAGDVVAADNMLYGPDLVNPNLTKHALSVAANDRYSYIHLGSAQVLDHALTTQATNTWVRGFAYGRGNSDAAVDLINNAGTLLRASDHDGAVIFFMSDANADGIPDDSQSADLSITKLASPDPVLTGGTLTYTLTVTNAGPAVAGPTTVTDTLPAGVSFVSASGTGWTCVESTGIVECDAAVMPVGTAADITVAVTVSATSGTLTNTAVVSSFITDPNPANNTATTITTVIAQADLAVTMSAEPTATGPGGSFVHAATVSNLGPADASGVVLTLTLPAGAVVGTITPGACVPAADVVTCTVGPLAVAGTFVATVEMTASVTGTYTTAGVVAGTEPDPVPANDTATAATAIGQIIATPNPVNMRVPMFTPSGSMTLNITNDSSIAVGFTLLERPNEYAWARFAPAGPTWNVPAVNSFDRTARAVPQHPRPQIAATPLAPNAALDFPAGLVLPWGIGYNTMADDMWINDVADAGGDGLNHRFLTSGVNTGDTIDISSWVGSWAADMTYDPFADRLWQMNVGGDNCIHEMDPATKTSTGNSICPGFPVSQRGLAFDPVTDTFFSGSWNDGAIRRFDRNGDELETVSTGLDVSGLAYNPGSGHLFVLTNTDAAADLYVLDVNNAYAVVSSFKLTGMADFDQAGLEADCAGNLYAVSMAGDVFVAPSGETGFCSFSTVPWLDETPKSGALAPGATQPVTLDFITALQWPGFHRATLRVAGTDPFAPVNVPVNYTIAFLDVPVGSFADAHIHALAGARITRGCGEGNFCPDDTIDRAEMAILMVRAMHGPLYAPPSAVGIFSDVVVTDTDNTADYVEQLYRDGVVAGCGTNPLRYCPNDLVNRAQMSVFVAKGLGIPTAPDTGFFTDVSGTIYAGFAPYAEALYNNGITAGCGDHIFCPATEITRNQLAVWLVKALGLPMAPPTP